MADIQEIVNRVALPGIPWAQIQVGSQDPAFNDAYIKQYLVPAGNAASAVFDRYQFAPSAAEIQDLDSAAVQAYQAALSAVTGKLSTVLAAANKGQHELSMADSLQMPLVTLRTSVLSAYFMGMYGAVMHVNATYQRAILAGIQQGKIDPATAGDRIRTHADSCYRLLTSIPRMEAAGAFTVVPKASGAPPAPAAGVGQITLLATALVEGGPIGWVIIAVTSVLIIGLLACLVYYLKTTTEQSQQALDIIDQNCAAARKANDWSTVQQCNTLATDARKPMLDKLAESMTSIVQKAIPWLIGAGLVVGGVYFAPLVVRKLSEARKVAKAS